MKMENTRITKQKSSGDVEIMKYGVDWALKRIIESVPKTVWAAMLSSFLFGLIVHLQSFSGFILNRDTTRYKIAPHPNNLLSQGKWLWRPVSRLMPLINIDSYDGIYAIIIVSITVALVIHLLQMHSMISSVLVGMIMVSFPSLMNMFPYGSEYIFCFAMFLAVAAAFFIAKNKSLLGIVLLTLSLGIYPAYIGATASVLLFLCIIDLLENKKSEKEVVKQGFKYMGVLLISIILHYTILMAIVNHSGTKLSSYRGIDSALANPSFSNYFTSLCESYLKVIKFYMNDAYGRSFSRDIWCYRIIVILILMILITLIRNNKIYQNYTRLILVILLIPLMPIAIHAVGILGQNADTHWIMIYPFVFIFIFVIKLSEEAAISEWRPYLEETMKESVQNNPSYMGTVEQWIAVGVTLVILLNWFQIANAGYAKLKVSYEGAYTHCVMIVDELISIPEYDPQKPLVVIGANQTLSEEPFGYMQSFGGVSSGRGFLRDNTDYVYFIRDYLGINLEVAPLSINEEIAQTAEFKEMTNYPSPGFVREINGYLVVKLSDI